MRLKNGCRTLPSADLARIRSRQARTALPKFPCARFSCCKAGSRGSVAEQRLQVLCGCGVSNGLKVTMQRCGRCPGGPPPEQRPVGTTTGWNNYRYIRYCATLKPKDFPDRAIAGRFLDGFESLSRRLVAGRFWATKNSNNQFWARPIVTSQ
jgi:hypothetical protein